MVMELSFKMIYNLWIFVIYVGALYINVVDRHTLEILNKKKQIKKKWMKEKDIY